MNEEVEFQRQRTTYLNSPEGFEVAKTEVLDMFADIEEKIKKLHEKKFYFGFEKEVYNPLFILKCEGFILVLLGNCNTVIQTKVHSYMLDNGKAL